MNKLKQREITIKNFLSQYEKNNDGNWLKKNCPTEGYLTPVVIIPGETNQAYNLLEELLKERKRNEFTRT